MPGFDLSLNCPDYIQSSRVQRTNIVYDHLDGNQYRVSRFTIDKFIDDKLFFESEKYIIILEGVILNKIELIKLTNATSWAGAICFLFETKGDRFFSELRGSFSGCFYDKEANKWLVFTDHIGSKHVYYCSFDNSLIISSEVVNIYQFLQTKAIKFDLDIDAAYMLLSYGFMLDDFTLNKGVKKLLPGHYLIWENDEFCIKRYYTLPLRPANSLLNESEIIEELDIQFRKAIERQFDKDVEYGYKHLASLSGGLDSRMTSWVAHELGYIDQLNITFSQSNYLDETIPKKIAADLKHEWLFKALDNGLFLKDIDDITKITGGNVLYYGLAHSNSLMEYMNFNDLGILHSGQLGDVVIGTFIKDIGCINSIDKQGAYSNKFVEKISYKSDSKNYMNLELYLMFQRGFNGANNGLSLTQHYTETLSPFYDVDFMEFCFKLPLEIRLKHNLYKKWILKKYPDAAKYVWEKTKSKINMRSYPINILGKSFSVDRKSLKKIFRKLGWIKTSIDSKNHMNPLEYWYNTNGAIKSFQDNYFKDNVHLLSSYKELKSDCETLYMDGNAIEKNQVLSLLSALKLFN